MHDDQDTGNDTRNGRGERPAQTHGIEELHIATVKPGQDDRRRAKRERKAAATAAGGTGVPQADGKRRRKPWAWWVYVIVFVVADFLAVAIMQVGVTQTSTRVELSSASTTLWTMIAKMAHGNFVLLLNMLIVGLVYVVLLMAINRLWIATGILLAVATVIAAVEHLKIGARYEAILPSDLNFLSGGNGGDIMSFMPADGMRTIIIAAVTIVAIVAVCVVCGVLDGRHGSLVRGAHKALGACVRVICMIVPALLLCGYTSSVGTVDSWAYHVSRGMGDTPSMWDSAYDAQRNGPVVAFLRQLKPKIMDMPDGYSKEKMDEIASKYAKQADSINEHRDHKLTDSTVIYVLSESFSDPTRVPGVELNKDPMPYIRQLKGETTSGLMLSSGYGGGTANLEYMGLTGLSMTNFDSSLTSPYQQLVPTEHWMPTVNRLWGAPQYSIGLHPYEPSMYSRESNYKKMGFSHFYALEGDDIISHQDRIDDSPYVSDESTYESTVEEVKKTDDNQFLQVITMQNHMPYNNWYKDNEFEVSDSADSKEKLTDKEKESIRTYAKGMELTDEATKKFLEELDAIDKPVTVVFYGDHLPGIYSTAGADPENSLELHLTDYFIWSNKASEKNGVSNTTDDSNVYSSPNYFIAQAADQMHAKVSPYLAFLTEMHERIAAMEPPVVNTIQGWDRIPEGQNIYLDAEGKPMSVADMDAETKQMLEDYKLIQYDIVAGDNYLKETDFMTLPTS
ncbi:MAG: LTA synthase family protein [Bifidobacterium sp.]|nr:LTA synthase family protein [Bifidobacterium sp.]